MTAELSSALDKWRAHLEREHGIDRGELSGSLDDLVALHADDHDDAAYGDLELTKPHVPHTAVKEPMMTAELKTPLALVRAPDPTLTATLYSMVWVSYDEGAVVPVAHVVTEGCHAQLINPMHPKHARWFAVPCRTCFPHAPEPGLVDRRVSCCREVPSSGQLLWRDPHLAWQVRE